MHHGVCLRPVLGISVLAIPTRVNYLLSLNGSSRQQQQFTQRHKQPSQSRSSKFSHQNISLIAGRCRNICSASRFPTDCRCLLPLMDCGREKALSAQDAWQSGIVRQRGSKTAAAKRMHTNAMREEIPIDPRSSVEF